MKRTFLALGLALTLPLAASAAPEVLSANADGVPTFLRGDLGFVDASAGVDPNGISDSSHAFRISAQNTLRGLLVSEFGAIGGEDVDILRATADDLGQVHVRFQQTMHGLNVDGATLILHADAASGEVFAVNGEFATARGVATEPTIGPRRAFDSALETMGLRGATRGKAQRAYVLDKDSTAVLAWKAMVEYRTEEGPRADWIFVDATTGAVAAIHPTIHTAKSWRTYSANNGTSLPGSLRCSGTQSCGTTTAQNAHNNASKTYDYLNVKFGRDSLNNNGQTMVSTVNYGNNYNNAFWNGSQMVYGDGDGSVFSPLGNAFDVVAHEFGHGVTSNESNLIYQNESGALNEAMSDIIAAGAEAWADGGITSNTWKLGEDIYTPGTSGDALRYLNDPIADGSSRDYYPTRYTGSQDSGGVHWNSGIANLAFYLSVQGGTHPRGKTSVNVTAVGLSQAEQIFYRANSVYLTQSSNFQAARNATAQAAQDLYGTTSKNRIHLAWDAVGVPGSPGGGGGGGGTSALSNGVPKTGLSGSSGSTQFFTIAVPSGASNLVVSMSGGSGDADLYVRAGSPPTTSSYDCRPYKNGNNETCSFSSPSATTYHVMIRGYSSFSGVSLVASFDTSGGGGGGCTPGGGNVSNISGASNSQQFWTVSVPSCATSLVVAMSGGSGDADLYTRFNANPTTSTYECRPYKNGNNETCTKSNPNAGTWHIMVRGYTSFSGVNLDVDYN